MDKLERCPFCGGEFELQLRFGITGFMCKKCGALISFVGSERKKDAIKMLNRRIPLAEPSKEA